MALIIALLAITGIFVLLLIILLVVLANLPKRPYYGHRVRSDLKKIKRQIEEPEDV